MLRVIPKLAVAMILLLAGSLALLAYLARDAKTRVHAFCGSVLMGDPSARLKERAQAAGLEVHALPADDDDAVEPAGTVLCTRGMMLAHHVCEVRFSRGRVTSTRLSFVD